MWALKNISFSIIIYKDPIYPYLYTCCFGKSWSDSDYVHYSIDLHYSVGILNHHSQYQFRLDSELHHYKLVLEYKVIPYWTCMSRDRFWNTFACIVVAKVCQAMTMRSAMLIHIAAWTF